MRALPMMQMCSFAVMILRQAVFQAERASAKVALIRDLQALHSTYLSMTVITFHVNRLSIWINVLKVYGKLGKTKNEKMKTSSD
jgi:hypothetical protein